jgi:hypothetical protein
MRHLLPLSLLSLLSACVDVDTKALTEQAVVISSVNDAYGWCPEMASWPLEAGSTGTVSVSALPAVRSHFTRMVVSISEENLAAVHLEGGDLEYQDCGTYEVVLEPIGVDFVSAWYWPEDTQ